MTLAPWFPSWAKTTKAINFIPSLASHWRTSYCFEDFKLPNKFLWRSQKLWYLSCVFYCHYCMLWLYTLHDFVSKKPRFIPRTCFVFSCTLSTLRHEASLARNHSQRATLLRQRVSGTISQSSGSGQALNKHWWHYSTSNRACCRGRSRNRWRWRENVC